MKLEDKGGRRLCRTLADSGHAQRVAEIREGMHEMDRSYAMNLGTDPKGHTTRTE